VTPNELQRVAQEHAAFHQKLRKRYGQNGNIAAAASPLAKSRGSRRNYKRKGEIMTLESSVLFWNHTKGWGFLKSNDPKVKNYFVHASSLVDCAGLKENERVVFELGTDSQGRTYAVNVRVVVTEAPALEVKITNYKENQNEQPKQ
jgi:cold shock CspA family protein